MKVALTPLGALGVSVLDCEHRTPIAQPHGHPYIAIPDIVAGRVDLVTTRRISDADLASWTRRTRPLPGDVIVTRRGRVGDTAAIPDGVDCAIGQNLVLLRSDGVQIDQRYLRWATRGTIWRGEVDRLRNVGAVFSSLNVNDIPKIRIPAPPISEQKAIAEVLEALDDKISANDRLIRIAGELADAQFTSASMGTEFGPDTFNDVAQVGGGATPRTGVEEFWAGDVLWATPTDVTGLRAPHLTDTIRKITKAGLASCSSPLYPAGSILMTSRATIGAFAVAERPMAVNQGFIVVNAKDPDLKWWLFHEMQSRVEEFLAHANGATFLELPRGRFKQLPVRRPTPDVATQFARAVGPLHDLSAQLLLEGALLCKSRDELLRHLMSGRLRVKDAETIAEEAL